MGMYPQYIHVFYMTYVQRQTTYNMSNGTVGSV